ncbi:MAG: Crp/Fnr family transcriptional regulator, partial [Alphaproteobacteria bacterium]
RELHRTKRRFDRHRDIIAQGRPYRSVFILCSGFAWRYKILPDGKRQLLSFGLPGDLIGFPACFFENAVNATGSLTEVVVATVPFTTLYDLFARFPRIAVALFWMSAREAAIYGERIVDIGRRSAYERLAHLILELLTRLRAVGLADELSYLLPLTPELPLLVPWLPPGAALAIGNLSAARRRSLIGINVRCCGVAPQRRRVSPHREFQRVYTFLYGAANDSDPSHHRAGPLCLDDGLCWFGRYANPRLLRHPLRTRPPARDRGSLAPPDAGYRHRCPGENGTPVEELNAPWRHAHVQPYMRKT